MVEGSNNNNNNNNGKSATTLDEIMVTQSNHTAKLKMRDSFLQKGSVIFFSVYC